MDVVFSTALDDAMCTAHSQMKEDKKVNHQADASQGQEEIERDLCGQI